MLIKYERSTANEGWEEEKQNRDRNKFI